MQDRTSVTSDFDGLLFCWAENDADKYIQVKQLCMSEVEKGCIYEQQ